MGCLEPWLNISLSFVWHTPTCIRALPLVLSTSRILLRMLGGCGMYDCNSLKRISFVLCCNYNWFPGDWLARLLLRPPTPPLDLSFLRATIPPTKQPGSTVQQFEQTMSWRTKEKKEKSAHSNCKYVYCASRSTKSYATNWCLTILLWLIVCLVVCLSCRTESRLNQGGAAS